MLFMYLLSILSFAVQILFGIMAFEMFMLSFSYLIRYGKLISWVILLVFVYSTKFLYILTFAAAGLYYLAELVEEYTVMAKYIISWIIIITTGIHIGLIIFEDLPLHINALGLLQQLLHRILIRDFPVVRVTSFIFLMSILNLLVHHYFAFTYFGNRYYSFSEVLSYFTLCLWVVPFALFVSLTANDYVLPTTGEKQALLGDNNVVTDYLSRKAKRYSLLSFFSFAKESILPQRSKKAF